MNLAPRLYPPLGGGQRVSSVSACYTRAVQARDSALKINPNVELIFLRDAGPITAVTVRAPVKGHGLRITRIERAVEPEVFGALLVHAVTRGALGPASDLTTAERDRLADIGFLVPDEQVSSPVWFSCDVTDPPCDFIPSRARRPSARVDQLPDLVTTPTLRHLGPVSAPTDARAWMTPHRFRQDRSWVAIEDAATSATCVYSYPSESHGDLSGLVPGMPPPETLTRDVRQHLFEAGIIESPVEAARQRDARVLQIATTGQAFREQRYVVVPHIMAPLQLAAVRRYYRALIAEGFLPFGDKEWPDRYFSYRDPVGCFFQHELANVVSEIAGERVKASFSFFASYHRGSMLPPHRDREQCEYSISILLDHSPEPEDLSPWPIYLQPPGAQAALPVSIGAGDAVLYRGREVLHYRDRLTDAEYCSFWFFFYVPESFSGSLD